MVKVTNDLQNANKETFEVSKREFEILDVIRFSFDNYEYNEFFKDLSLFYTDMLVCQGTNANPCLIEDYASTVNRLLNFLNRMNEVNEIYKD